MTQHSHTTRLAQLVASHLGRQDFEGSAVSNEELVERISRRLLAYFTRLVGPAEAEDCLQETLVALQESFLKGRYDRQRSFNAWAWLKARTVYAQWCRTHQRLQRAVAEGAELQGETTQPTPATRVDARLDASQLLDKLALAFGEETRELFVLYYEGDLSQDQVAELVGRDPKTVRKRLRAAHRFLEQALAEPEQ